MNVIDLTQDQTIRIEALNSASHAVNLLQGEGVAFDYGDVARTTIQLAKEFEHYIRVGDARSLKDKIT